MKDINERRIHSFFYVVLTVKFVIALSQVVGGIIAYLFSLGKNVFVYFVSTETIHNFIKLITSEELSEDPRDFLANYFLHFAQTISMSTVHFVAFYLITHGLIKLWLITGLLQRKLWYYPISIIIFCLFMVYQIYRFTLTHSPFLIFLSIVDVFVIWLTWHEYKHLQSLESTEAQ